MNKSAACFLSVVALAGPLTAQQSNFTDYWPIDTNYTWVYTNSTNPLDTYTTTVLGMTDFAGQPAWEIFEAISGDSVFVENDGSNFTVYGFEESGMTIDIPDIVLGPFSDGDTYSLDPTSLLTVIREWSALDHSLTGAYGIDQSLCDVLAFVTYDLGVTSPGLQNPALESGGGTQYPNGIVFVEWFQRGKGQIACQDFFDDGNFDGPRYDVTANFVVGSNFCSSVPNSATPSGVSCGAVIRASGSASVAANDLVLTANPVPAEPGVFYYGPLALAGAPFGDGLRCVGGQVVRIFPITFGVNGTMTSALDNTLPTHSVIQPGASLHFQAWFRDPAAGMSGFNLSNGLTVSFGP